MAKSNEILLQLAGIVFDQTFGVKPRSTIHEDLIERRFARFKSGKGVLDEPIALLSLKQYFKLHTPWMLEYFARIGLSDNCPSKRGSVFETFISFWIVEAFKRPRPLDEVFEFIQDSPLQSMMAQLVSVSKTGDGFSFMPVGVHESPSYTLGYTTLTEDETLSLLKNPRELAYCFPCKTIGPDGIFFLLLSDGSLLRVLWQFKNHSKPRLSVAETKKGFRTTDSKNFVTNKHRRASEGSQSLSSSPDYYIRNVTKHEALQEALLAYGRVNERARKHGFLRVFCSYPATPDLNTLQSVLQADQDRHPAATVKFQSILTDDLAWDAFGLLSKKVQPRQQKKHRVSEEGRIM